MVQIPTLLECQKPNALRQPGGETRSIKAGGNSKQKTNKQKTVSGSLAKLSYQILPVLDFFLHLLFLIRLGPWDPDSWTCYSQHLYHVLSDF